MTKTVDTAKAASKREKIKSDGPGFLDPVWYSMSWYIWHRAVVWYGMVPYHRPYIKHFYNFDVIFFDSTIWYSKPMLLAQRARISDFSQNHKNFL